MSADVTLPPLPEPDGWRITDGEGGYDYSDESPDKFARAWAGRYQRQYHALFTADTTREYARAAVLADRERRVQLSIASSPSVVSCIEAYGDSRAKNDGMSVLRYAELILAMRQWGALQFYDGRQRPAPPPAAQEADRG